MPKTGDTSGRGLALGPLVSGVLYAFVCCAICAAVYALSVSRVPTLEKYLPFAARAVMMLSAFIGGLAAGRKSDRAGWLHGALVGLIYVVFTMVIGKLARAGDIPVALLIQRMLFTVVVSAIGGVAGVNL